MVATRGLMSLLAHKRSKAAEKERGRVRSEQAIQGVFAQLAQAKQQQDLLDREDEIREEKNRIADERWQATQQFAQDQATYKQQQDEQDRQEKRRIGAMERIAKAEEKEIKLAAALGIAPGDVGEWEGKGYSLPGYKMAAAAAGQTRRDREQDRVERARATEKHEASMAEGKADLAKKRTEHVKDVTEMVKPSIESAARSMMPGVSPQAEDPVLARLRENRQSMEDLARLHREWDVADNEADKIASGQKFINTSLQKIAGLGIDLGAFAKQGGTPLLKRMVVVAEQVGDTELVVDLIKAIEGSSGENKMIRDLMKRFQGGK